MTSDSLFELPEEPPAPVASRLVQPVARVLLQVPLPHLNQSLDYLVPEKWDAQAQPGVRVVVTLAGRKVDGYVIERATESKHHRLAELVKVVSPVPVLTPEVLALAQAVALRNAGAVDDVLRHAIPPRHARAEKAVLKECTEEPAGGATIELQDHRNRSSHLQHLHRAYRRGWNRNYGYGGAAHAGTGLNSRLTGWIQLP